MMHTVLHILTQPDDAFAQEILTRQKGGPEANILAADLTMPEPDYKLLLENIFAADTVETW